MGGWSGWASLGPCFFQTVGRGRGARPLLQSGPRAGRHAGFFVLTDVALLVLFALVGNLAFGRLGLPGILGMIATGVVLGPAGRDLSEPGILTFLEETKTAALIVSLVRAGRGSSKTTLNRIGGPAIRMSFVPGLVEGSVVTAAAYTLLDLPFLESGMLGFIIAAVSPAVVVPTMLDLKERGFGERKEVPTLVLAGASVDDVVASTVFGVFAGLASGGDAGIGHLLVAVPSGVLLGALIGAALGFVAILAELGYSSCEIAELRARGAV